MKTDRIYRVLGILLAACWLSFAAGACGEDIVQEVAEDCSLPQACAVGDASITWQACCTEVQCRYKTNDGASFWCDGLSCDAAAQELVNYCMGQ